jgi:chromosome segregation ATPase
MDEIIVKYRAEIDGYKAELENIKKADKTTREVVEKPININANTKDLKDALKAIAVASGEIDFINIDQELNALVKDSGKLKKLFDELANSASKMEKGSAEYNGLLSVMGAIDAEIKSLTQSTETFEDTSVKATKSLKAQLREAQADVARLSDEFGVTSKEAVTAAKRAAELKDEIGDAKALTDAFNPDAKFQALTSSLGGVLGGFQAYEGALALIGSESEDLQKTLVKLQGIMALSQGLQQMGEAKDSFKQLGAVVKDKVMTAFTTLRGAMAALGIGAIVIAIGLIVANWEELVGWIEKTFPGLKKVTDFFKNFQQVSAGVMNAVTAGFKRLGSIVANFFSGLGLN